MSYGVAAALQAAVFQRLSGWPALMALVGAEVHDALPSGPVPALYVALGPEVVRDRSDQTGHGAEHDFTVSVVTDMAGFAAAKEAAAAVSDALVDAPLTLERGRLIALNFHRAMAARAGGKDRRQITLHFRARVEDD
ncbi:MAG: DUF3168 domain-containing protein [Limimaricola sp.]|uniref:DUF3168 domain-containing protein n=1 Tax=Limimaricola sp. TaxID=2211665 RepID=UPI001D32CBCD|nr:DUF3168 domain-containing protein [Limimaricola sp.]MBI1416684.1 DUF3168 domain-containing protein [Limimaricola sp.]